MSELFDGVPTNMPVVPPTVEPVIGDPELTSVLVGEGRKYKTIDELAKGYMNADEHIARLVADNTALKAQVATASTLDQVLAKLQKPAAQPDQVQQAPGTTLDVAAVEQLVKTTVTGLASEQTRTRNRQLALAGLAELFGEKAQEVWNREAPTPEKKDALTRLAETDPAKLVQLFRPADKPMPMMQESTVNLGAQMSPKDKATIVGTKEYYSKMRKDNPKLYWSQDNQQTRDQIIRENPARYFGTG